MNTTLTPIVLVGGVGMILVALGFVALAVIKKLGWTYLGLGALGWIVTVVVKFVWAILLNPNLYATLTQALPNGIGSIVFDVYVGLLTGFTEVAIVYLVMRFTRWGKVDWKNALAFAIGFGAIESLLLGLGSLATMAVALAMPQQIPTQAMTQLAIANDIFYSIAPVVERFFTVWVHLFCNVLIFFAVARNQARWLWLSFAFKSCIDAVAAYAQTANVIASVQGIWSIEAIVILFGILGWLGTRWVQSRYADSSANTQPTLSELATSIALVGVIVLMTVGAGFGFLNSQGAPLTGAARDAVLAYSEAKTDNLMQAIHSNEYAAFSRDLNDRMKSAVTETSFAAMQKNVVSKIGNHVSRQVNSVVETNDNVTIVYTAKFENDDPVTMRVSFEKAEPHRISGLWFDSAKLR